MRGFGLLVEDMDAAMGEGWGDLGFEEAMAFLGRPEAADLLYHLLVLLADAGLSLDDVRAELARREGVGGLEEKAGRG